VETFHLEGFSWRAAFSTVPRRPSSGQSRRSRNRPRAVGGQCTPHHPRITLPSSGSQAVTVRRTTAAIVGANTGSLRSSALPPITRRFVRIAAEWVDVECCRDSYDSNAELCGSLFAFLCTGKRSFRRTVGKSPSREECEVDCGSASCAIHRDCLDRWLELV